MDAKTILLESLDTRWKKFRAELKTCRNEFSEEAVHDLRVATRRLLALFDLLRALLPRKRVRKVRRMLKDQLDELDDLRDTQVLLADISEFIHDIPELKMFQERLQKNEKTYLRHTRKAIRSRKAGELSGRIEKIRGMIESLPDESLREQTLSAADDRFAHVLQAYAAMDTENIPSIHKLRVAFKKFRYTVEIVHPLLETFPAENFERMHDYQSMMGDIQDLEVASEQLTELKDTASSSDTSTRLNSNLEPVSAHYASRLRTAVLGFVEDKGEVLTFWRNTPDGSFPWEKPL